MHEWKCQDFYKQNLWGLHMRLGKAKSSGCTSVGEGRSSGVASSGVFKSTDSQKRSSINDYFRLFKIREDRKGGRGSRVIEEKNSEAGRGQRLLLCS